MEYRKFFRTAKQKLDIGDCQARKLEKQTFHILASFACYAIAQSIKVYEGYKSSDEVTRLIRAEKNDPMLYNP